MSNLALCFLVLLSDAVMHVDSKIISLPKLPNLPNNIISTPTPSPFFDDAANSTHLTHISTCDCVYFTGEPDNFMKDHTFCADSTHDGRRTYNSGSKWLFFDSSDSTWNLDSSPPSGQVIVDASVEDSAQFPELITGVWTVGNSIGIGGGIKNYSMKVHCGKWKAALPAWAIGLIVAGLSVVFLVFAVWIRVRRLRLRRSAGASVPYGVMT